MKKVFRLANKYLYNKPLLSSQEQLEEIQDYLDTRGIEELAIKQDLKYKAEQGSLGEGEIAIIPVSGALTYEDTGWEALCGMSSYQGILSMMRQAVKEKFSTVVLDVDSGGGEAYGVFETAEELRKLATDNNIRLLAYVDGTAASAAYGLAVAAEEIIVNPMASVGSVGVVTQLSNTSEKDKKEGIERVYVYAGESKIPYDSEGKFTKEFIDGLQEKVDGLYEGFLSHVADMRGIEKEAVRSTQAKVFSADKALQINFVDKIMTRNEFAEYLADIQDNGDRMALNSLNLSVKEEKEKMQLEEMQKTLDAAVADKEEALSQLADIKDQLSESQSNLTELTSKLEQANEQLTNLENEKAQAKLDSRKTSLAEVLPEDKLDAIFNATKDLEDSAFESILGGYKAAADTLENSELFKENGVDAEADKSEEEVSSVMKLIKQSKNK